MSQHRKAYVISYHGVLCHDYRGIPMNNTTYQCSRRAMHAAIIIHIAIFCFSMAGVLFPWTSTYTLYIHNIIKICA